MNDKRLHERYDRNFTIRIYNPEMRKSIELFGQGLNISRGGILFHTLATLNLNSKCKVVFSTINNLELEKSGRILRMENADAAKYPQIKAGEQIYAMQFDKLLSPEEMNSIRVSDTA
jgi:hypothetical protein